MFQDKTFKPNSINVHSVTVYIRHKRQEDVNVSHNKIRKFICEENNLNFFMCGFSMMVRGLWTNDTFQTLHLDDGDTIDVFLEIKGGDLPTKRFKDIMKKSATFFIVLMMKKIILYKMK